MRTSTDTVRTATGNRFGYCAWQWFSIGLGLAIIIGLAI